ncbi:rDNA transcriptional regulator pol5-like [Dendronephthya gigantea]|uniref:rDNA transcriptional regulator pol5-like n=1 Tax=Dendronephthya gigantea TaxID=151771 RepID=UPI00106A4C0D|nr:rDNA transcriptional regulator pol5-like [Dendronephthya gigantea]
MSEKTLLSHFWDLASTNEKIRIDAGVTLIQYLRSPKNEQAIENDSTTEERLDDLSYTLKRLIKGLASSRKAARQGFAMALTEIVLMFDTITVDDIINLIKESLTVTKTSSSQEERDAYIGQIFGLVALGRAICLAKDNNNKKLQRSSIKLVIERIKEVLAKKSYLQETCYRAIVDIITMLNFSEFEEYVMPILENEIKCVAGKCTPDSLVLILASWRLFKDDIGRKTFKKSWASCHLDAIDNYLLFAKILQNAHTSHPRVHIVWDEVLNLVLNSSRSDFEKFWMTVVDENLFQSSHERKFMGFKVLEKVLPILSSEQVAIVFSPQLMHCLFNSLGHDTNYLYPAIKQMIEGLANMIIVNGKQELIPQILKQLLGRNSNICFDAVTKTKTVENLLSKLQLQDLPSFVSWLKEIFIAGTSDLKKASVPGQVDKTREGVLGMFLSLVRCKQLEHTSLWVLDAVFFVFENAYFVQTISPAISSRTRSLCQQRFNSILGELASLTGKHTEVKSKEVSSKVQTRKFGYAEDDRLWISHIMQHAKNLLRNPEKEVIEESWNDEVQAVFIKTMKIVRKLEDKSTDLTLESSAFTLMFLYVGVQLFGETQQAQEILEELFHCFNKVKAQISDKPQENEPHWMDVVTEILLSLLTETSNLRRLVVGQVFNIIVTHLTSSAVKIILEAIDPRNGLNEDSALQIEENDEDQEMISGDEDDSQGGDNDESEEEETSSDDDDDDDDTKDSVDPLFKVDLQAALGNALANEDDDEKEAEQSDSDLDDDAMMKFDEALSEVFKQHLTAKQEKKKMKDAKKSLLHFKLRVLDLVEIIIKKQPSTDLILELMQPILEIIRTCLTNKDFTTLGERAQGIFKNRLCAIKEHPKLSPSNVESVHSNIEILLKQAIKAPSVTMVTLMSTGCLFLIRHLRGAKESDEKQKKMKYNEQGNEFVHLDFSRVSTAYSEALKDFMIHRNTHLHPLLFQELINRYPKVGWGLAKDLVNYITQGINNFRKIQACTMLSQLLNRKVYGQNENIKAIAKPLQEAFHSTFLQLSSSHAEMKAKHLRQILKLVSQFVKILKADSELWPLLEKKKMEESLDIAFQSKTAERANDLKNLISRLKDEIMRRNDAENTGKKTKRKRKCKPGESNMSDETSNNGLENFESKDSEITVMKKKKRKADKEDS